jgi:4'-phosphopantetheinyl transferase
VRVPRPFEAETASPPPAGEVHVWCTWLDGLEDASLFASYAELMTAGERARNARYMFERSRREHLVGRALVRTTLSRYADVDPRAWVFREGERGRPEIDGPAGAPPLRFNLSHTTGLVALAVATGRDVGVDVEDAARDRTTVEIADRFFSPREVADLRALPAEAQRDRFFTYWTLKEAYIKARGLGLAIPLHHFSFLLSPSAPVGIAFAPELDDDPASWQFERMRPSPRHHLAVAVRRRAERDLRVVVRDVVPLGGDAPAPPSP